MAYFPGRITRETLWFLSIAYLAALPGCGGNHTSSGLASGHAVVSVTWADRSRLIPLASESIQVKIVARGNIIRQGLLKRPPGGGTATATFDTLPTGPASVEASALPAADGTGVAQAHGTVPVTIVGGQQTAIHLSLDSTIDHLIIDSAPAQLPVGHSSHLIVTARDVDNNIVLTSSSTLAFQSLTPDILSVAPDGTITAMAPGQGKARIQETESGKEVVCTLDQPVTRWNVYDDFTVAANPNGVWTYGYWLAFNETVRPFTKTRQDGEITAWYSGRDPFNFHAVNRYTGNTTINDGNSAHPTFFPPHTLWMHPGNNQEYTVTQWTAPVAGPFKVHATFTGLSDTSTGVFVLANGNIIYSGFVFGYLQTQSMDQTVTIAPGQTIQFVVSDGGNGWDFDSTALDASIEAQ